MGSRIARPSAIRPLFCAHRQAHYVTDTGMDALTHALEVLVTRNSGPYTDVLEIETVRIIGKHLRRAVSTPGDREARRMIMLASVTVGLAFPNTGLGAVHGLTAPIGGHLDIPHGHPPWTGKCRSAAVWSIIVASALRSTPRSLRRGTLILVGKRSKKAHRRPSRW